MIDDQILHWRASKHNLSTVLLTPGSGRVIYINLSLSHHANMRFYILFVQSVAAGGDSIKYSHLIEIGNCELSLSYTLSCSLFLQNTNIYYIISEVVFNCVLYMLTFKSIIGTNAMIISNLCFKKFQKNTRILEY